MSAQDLQQGLRIVVADDMEEMCVCLQALLQHQGHQAFTVANGQQLVEACRALEPDLVITDVKMPGLDGIAAAEAVNWHRPTPIILVSGYDDEETLARVQTSYVMAYLVKPVLAASIKTAIAVALARFRESQQVEQQIVQLRQTLEERKVIERAKGAVMKRLGLSEEAAFSRIRKMANDANLRMIAVAGQVLQAEECFRALERPDFDPSSGTDGGKRRMENRLRCNG